MSTGDLVSALDEHSIGDKVTLKIRRDAGNGNSGKELELNLTLQEEVTECNRSFDALLWE